MAQRIGRYKISKKEAQLSTIDSVTPGGAIDGDLSGMDSISSATLTTTGVATINGNLKGVDEYSYGHAFNPERAQQASWVTEYKRGITSTHIIICD